MAAFDPVEPTVPAAPRVDSVTRSAGGEVHLSWSEPDHGGADNPPPPIPSAALTSYKVYRKSGTGGTYALIATVTTGCPACKTTYDDATATDPNIEYFYKVTATNLIGEGANCGDIPIGQMGPTETPCVLNGLTILTDPANDELDMVPGHDVQHLWIAEPVAFAPNQLVFTFKMQSLATVPPNTRWPVTFTGADTVNYTVQMTNAATDYPAGCTTSACITHTPIFQYGPTANLGPPNTLVTIDPTAPGNTNPSGFNPDGTITIVVPTSGLGSPAPGQTISGFLTRIAVVVGGVITLTPDNMPDNLGPAGSYTLVGNAACAPNQPPVAALTATPLMGDAPLQVTFDGSGSSDPDGDTIASYTFTFGDGSPPVTQPSPTIMHLRRSRCIPSDPSRHGFTRSHQ